MRKHCRGRVRSRGKKILTPYSRMVALFRYEHMCRQWWRRELWTISQREALRLVAAGEAEQVVRMVGEVLQVVGYQALKPIRAERPSPATLTLSTMVAVGNETAVVPADPRYRQTSWERDECNKFHVWPLIGDTKAVAVRPRITVAERNLAEQLLATGGRRTLKAA